MAEKVFLFPPHCLLVLTDNLEPEKNTDISPTLTYDFMHLRQYGGPYYLPFICDFLLQTLNFS